MDCQVKANASFTICVAAKLLLKTVKLFSDNQITITQKKEDSIELKCGKSKYNIGMDCFPEGFPRIPIEEMTSSINIGQFYLKLGLKYANSFVDDENKNANMVAINIAEVDNKMVFTGLTNELMCRAAVPPISINKWDRVSVTTDLAPKLLSLLGDKGEVGISHNGKHAIFFTDSDSPEMFEVISTVANVKFPNSESLFSKRPENHYIINAIECNSAVKRLKLYASDGDVKQVLFECDGSNDITLTSSDMMTKKDGEEIITIDNVTKTPIRKFLAHDHLIQVLNSMDASDFILYYTEEKNRPSFIVPKVNTEEENIFCFLIAEYTK
jgi:DNA polymerase III sliding clamp (beta) subunit (PCNA family)